MVSLDAALEFVRQSDQKVWNRLIAEMNFTRRQRDEEAARKFAVGDQAAFDNENPPRSVSGQVVKVGRTRLVIAATGRLERISVPASLVRKVA